MTTPWRSVQDAEKANETPRLSISRCPRAPAHSAVLDKIWEPNWSCTRESGLEGIVPERRATLK